MAFDLMSLLGNVGNDISGGIQTVRNDISGAQNSFNSFLYGPNSSGPTYNNQTPNQQAPQLPTNIPQAQDAGYTPVSTSGATATQPVTNPTLTAPASPVSQPTLAMAAAMQSNQSKGSASDSKTPTPVEGVQVSSQVPKPQPPSQGAVNSAFNAYDNRATVQALQQLQSQYPQTTGPFGTTGALKGVLGLLGDMYLVKHGQQPVAYLHDQQQKAAMAMAGYEQDPEHAITRLAAVPGMLPQAIQANTALQEERLRNQQAEYTNQWRTGELQRQNATLQNQREQQVTPIVAGYLRAGAAAEAAGNKGAYAKAYQAAQSYAAARNVDIGPGSEDKPGMGLPSRYEDYQAGYGMTANQQQQASDKAAQRQQSNENSRRAAGARVQSAQISAGRPSDAEYMQSLIAKENAAQAGQGPPLSIAEQAWVDANRTRKNNSRGGSRPALTPAGAGGQPAAAPAAGVHTLYDQHGMAHQVRVQGNQWVDAQTGKPIQ